MKSSKFIELIKKRSFVVPLYLFQLRDKFDLELEEYLFLIYLSNLGEQVIFDPSSLASDFGTSLETVLSYVDNLTEKKLITLDVIKNHSNVMDEYIVLDYFYEKVTSYLIDDINQTKLEEEGNSTVFEAIEREFARPITSIEYEIISAWLEDGVQEELIMEALKEAIYSGVCNLRYIDKILYEWGKKGIKNKNDVDNNRSKFKEKQEKKEKLELFEYDWFEDGEGE